MDKLDMFQVIFVNVDHFVWWDMERTQTDDVMHFTSKQFQEGLSVSGGLKIRNRIRQTQS